MSPFLHKEIENHLLVLQNLFKKKISKQKWIVDAIKEKLQKQEKNPNNNKKNQERVGFKLDSITSVKLDLRVKVIRKHLGEYSKQQLILEALQERLTSEEEDVKQKILLQRLLLNELGNAKQ